MSFINILKETRTMVSEYMSGFDPSHDMHHVDRVIRLGMLTRSFYAFYFLEKFFC
jgi:hypothetical protein